MATGCGTAALCISSGDFPLWCMGSKVGGEPPANLPQIVIYGMEAENVKAGNICQPGGRKWWRLGARRMLPQRWDLVAGLGRPPTRPATRLRSFSPKPGQSVLASSRDLCGGQGLTLKTAKAKMAGLRLPRILKLSRMQSFPSHPHLGRPSLRPWNKARAAGRGHSATLASPGRWLGSRAGTQPLLLAFRVLLPPAASLGFGSPNLANIRIAARTPAARILIPSGSLSSSHPFPAGSQQPARVCVSLVPAPLGWALYNSPSLTPHGVNLSRATEGRGACGDGGWKLPCQDIGRRQSPVGSVPRSHSALGNSVFSVGSVPKGTQEGGGWESLFGGARIK